MVGVLFDGRESVSQPPCNKKAVASVMEPRL